MGGEFPHIIKRMEDERIDRVEESIIKLNHFTESFPKLMEVKMLALSDGLKLNRNLILIVLGGLVTGALGLSFAVLQFVRSMP